MQALRGLLWPFALLATFVLVPICGAYTPISSDSDLNLPVLILMTFIPYGILLMAVSLIGTGIAAWLSKGFRRYYLRVNLSVLLVLLLAFDSYYLYECSSFPEQFAKAEDYVAVARPALEHYLQQHGRYPDTLEKLDLKQPVPRGLIYKRDAGGFQSSPSYEGINEIYFIEYEGGWLCSDGKWFFDD